MKFEKIYEYYSSKLLLFCKAKKRQSDRGYQIKQRKFGADKLF